MSAKTRAGSNAGVLTTEAGLSNQEYVLAKEPIDGTVVRDLREIIDGRGSIIELWSLPWTESDSGLVVPQHCYQSFTDQGVIKAWHLHLIHTDQFTVTRGKLQVVLVDVRSDSPTYRRVNSIILGHGVPKLVLIPPGVLHGWKALKGEEVIVTNFQSHPYDPSDELKFRPELILTDIWEPKNG